MGPRYFEFCRQKGPLPLDSHYFRIAVILGQVKTLVTQKGPRQRGHVLRNLKVITFMHIPTMYHDDKINLSGLENRTIGHSNDVEHIWFHDDE